MGLPGSGKSYLADKIATILGAEWLNADRVREAANDWDLSPEGRTRQAERMKRLAQEGLDRGKHVIADFVCPTPKTRQDFAADYTVWVDTIKEGRFEDTNKMFVPPEEYDFRVPTQNAELWSLRIADEIQEHVWDNRKPTAQMLGRWQPWHEGHQALFEEIIKKTGQVNIQVRDVQGVGDNPFDFETVKKNIEQALRRTSERRCEKKENYESVCRLRSQRRYHISGLRTLNKTQEPKYRSGPVKNEKHERSRAVHPGDRQAGQHGIHIHEILHTVSTKLSGLGRVL